MLDKTYLGMQAEDILVCARWLSKKAGGQKIAVTAGEGVQPAALHAKALEPGLIAFVALEKPPMTWAETIRNPETHAALLNTVHGALRYYDLSDLKP